MNTPKTFIKRNIIITLVMIAISVILCTLGFNTASKPIDSIAVVWPGAILHAVGTILFGGWGVRHACFLIAIVCLRPFFIPATNAPFRPPFVILNLPVPSGVEGFQVLGGAFF